MTCAVCAKPSDHRTRCRGCTRLHAAKYTLARPLTPTDAEAQAKADELWEVALAGVEVAA